MSEEVLPLLFRGEDLWMAVDEKCILDAFLFRPFSFDGLGGLFLLSALLADADWLFERL